MLLTILYVGVRRADEARRTEFAARLQQAAKQKREEAAKDREQVSV